MRWQLANVKWSLYLYLNMQWMLNCKSVLTTSYQLWPAITTLCSRTAFCSKIRTMFWSCFSSANLLSAHDLGRFKVQMRLKVFSNFALPSCFLMEMKMWGLGWRWLEVNKKRKRLKWTKKSRYFTLRSHLNFWR